jgi:hypothetical protein
LPLSLRSPKLISFKTLVSEASLLPEIQSQIAIPRKSFLSLPVIFKATKEPQDIKIEYSTGGVAVPFALYFDQAIEAPAVPNVADRLNFAVTGSAQPEAVIQRTPRKTLIQFNSPKLSIIPPKVIHILEAESSGIFTLVWDNSSSVLSTRQVIFHASFVKRAHVASNLTTK